MLRQIEQLEFQLEDLQAASAVEEAQAATPAERPAAAKPRRRPLPGHLPREVHTYMPGHDACPDCGGRLEATLAKLSAKSDTAAAIRYALSRWRALTPLRRRRPTRDRQQRRRTGAALRRARPQNFLFAGSDSGGERAAAIYSLLGSAKLNGLDPEIDLHHVLQRIADHPISKINDLLPWNLALTTQQAPS